MPKDGELIGLHGNNSLQGMDDTKITHQRDRWIGQLNGQHENNFPKRWMDGELYGRHENNSPKEWTTQK